MSGDHNSPQNSSLKSSNRKMFLQEIYRYMNHLDNEPINPPEMIEKISKVIDQTGSLFLDGDLEERAMNPSENFLDSQVIKMSSDLAVRCSMAIGTDVNRYDKLELADHITRNFEFWQFTFPYEAPPVTYVCGALPAAPRPPRAPRAAPRATHRQQAAPAKMPRRADNIQSGTGTDEDPKVIERMYRRLKPACRERPMDYFEAVLDPTSFSRSVENVFRLSFLARDGRLSVYLDEATGRPVITALSSRKLRRQENSEEKQLIVTLTMKLWRDLIEAFDIREPFFKDIVRD